MHPVNKAHDQEVALARLYCWLVAILHPGWAMLMHLLLPNEFNDIVGRSVIGVSFLAIGLCSYFVKSLEKVLPTVCHAGYSLFAIHWFWLVYRSGMATLYIMGSLVVSFAFNLGFIRLRPLAVYSVVQIVSAVTASVLTEASASHKFMLVMGILTSQVVGLSFIFGKSRVMKELEAAETKALKLERELIDRELAAAQSVQKTLLATPLSDPRVSMSTYYRPAGRTGGDWYGHYHDPATDWLYLWIGDVTGHGVPAALVTGVVCGALYSGEMRLDQHGHDSSPVDRLRHGANVVNEIIRENGGELLMTMFFCGINLQTGELLYANAGHRPPFLVGTQGQVKQLNSRGNLLGLPEEFQFEVRETKMETGDMLFLYTDGLIENRGIGEKTLDRILLRRRLVSSSGSPTVVQEVTRGAEALWGPGELEDDVTILAITWKGGESVKVSA